MKLTFCVALIALSAVLSNALTTDSASPTSATFVSSSVYTLYDITTTTSGATDATDFTPGTAPDGPPMLGAWPETSAATIYSYLIYTNSKALKGEVRKSTVTAATTSAAATVTYGSDSTITFSASTVYGSSFFTGAGYTATAAGLGWLAFTFVDDQSTLPVSSSSTAGSVYLKLFVIQYSGVATAATATKVDTAAGGAATASTNANTGAFYIYSLWYNAGDSTFYILYSKLAYSSSASKYYEDGSLYLQGYSAASSPTAKWSSVIAVDTSLGTTNTPGALLASAAASDSTASTPTIVVLYKPSTQVKVNTVSTASGTTAAGTATLVGSADNSTYTTVPGGVLSFNGSYGLFVQYKNTSSTASYSWGVYILTASTKYNSSATVTTAPSTFTPTGADYVKIWPFPSGSTGIGAIYATGSSSSSDLSYYLVRFDSTASHASISTILTGFGGSTGYFIDKSNSLWFYYGTYGTSYNTKLKVVAGMLVADTTATVTFSSAEICSSILSLLVFVVAFFAAL